MSHENLVWVVDLVRQHGSVNKAASVSGLAYSTFNRRYVAAKAAGLADDLISRPTGVVPACPIRPSSRLPISVDECWGVLDQWLGRTRVPVTAAPKWKPGKTQRLVIASDFHAPFHDPAAVAAMIAREAATTDTLIINGDLMDFYSISRFLKYEQVPIEQELAATDALLAHLSASFPDILITSGNHDSPRFEKQLRSMLSPEMVHVIEYLTGGNLSVIHAMARRYPNVRFAPMKVGRFDVAWAAQVGDLIVTHAEKYSKVPGSALRGIDEWFTDQHDVLGLKPWRVLVQAHTHAGGIVPWKADRLLVECGCLSSIHGYQLTARISGRPQRRGYVTMTQHDGVTDINSVRFIWLDHDLRTSAS